MKDDEMVTHYVCAGDALQGVAGSARHPDAK
jgi:hypothetical protein